MEDKQEKVDFILMSLRDAISEVECRDLEDLDSDSLCDAVRYLENAIGEIEEL